MQCVLYKCAGCIVFKVCIHGEQFDFYIKIKGNKALAGQNHDLGINLNNHCPKGIHS